MTFRALSVAVFALEKLCLFHESEGDAAPDKHLRFFELFFCRYPPALI